MRSYDEGTSLSPSVSVVPSSSSQGRVAEPAASGLFSHVADFRQFTLVALDPPSVTDVNSNLSDRVQLDIIAMSSSNLFRSQVGNGLGASNGRSSTPTNFSGLLARSEALGSNPLTQDGRDSSELPQIHYGIGEIERQSEVVAGKGKRKAARGEG